MVPRFGVAVDNLNGGPAMKVMFVVFERLAAENWNIIIPLGG